MPVHRVPVGSYVRIRKQQLQEVIDQLRSMGYRTAGPRIEDEAIVYAELERVDQLPVGYLDEQDGGKYRLRRTGADRWFDYVVGPHSLKNFLFPPREVILECERSGGNWQMRAPAVTVRPLAVIGVRSCDLHALGIQDRVFLEGEYVDPAYRARRASLFLVAVNCQRAAATCFCHSMKTGPTATGGFDLALTELTDSFVVLVGTEAGGQVIAAAEWVPCTLREMEQAIELPVALKRHMEHRPAYAEAPATGVVPRERTLDTTDIRNVLMGQLEHPRWEQVAERCLACANCTLVCPTCFCSTVEDVADLTGDHARRERTWASCFTAEHSYLNSGTVRKTTASRYRQWLTHKLATWIDQFGTSGCTGCGRCITWCPVGIDLTEEVAALRGSA